MADELATLDLETARAIAYEGTFGDFIHRAEENLGETRWGVVKQTVFIWTPNGKYYAFEWEQGATEMQDDEFYEPVRVYRVKPVEVVKTEYQKI